MSSQLRDYYVTFHREEFIADLASGWRHAESSTVRSDFNIVTFIEQVVALRLKHYKGKLHIRFFDAKDDEPPAYVTVEPLALHVDNETWQLAKIGEPQSRFVLAHEVGHIVLHGHYPKAAFSSEQRHRLKAFPKENSAEWQADTFADYLLLPTALVAAFSSAVELAAVCSVPIDVALRRFKTVQRALK